jgi:hypothetical protein
VSNVTSTATKSRGGGGNTLEFQLKHRGAIALKYPAPAYRATIDRALLDALFDELAKRIPSVIDQLKQAQHDVAHRELVEQAQTSLPISVEPPLAAIAAATGDGFAERLAAEMLKVSAPSPTMSPIEQAIQLLVESLNARSEDEWVEFWQHGNRYGRFNDLLDGYFAAAVANVTPEVFAEDQQQSHDLVVGWFPQFHERICFAESTMRRAGKVVSAMVHRELNNEARRQRDAETAQLFNWNYGWFRIAVNALCAIARGWVPATVPNDLLLGISMLAREAALTAYHAACEGRRLRDEEERETAPPPPRPALDDDEDDLGDDDLVDVEADLERLENA